jgi:DNA-binding response OmpR family regulator
VNSFRILVVEDNQELLELIVKYLKLCGWRAVAANNEEYLWQELEREKSSLILLDIMIQGSDAFSLLSALKGDTRYSDIPVIAMTALGSMRDKNLCISAGFDKVLAKPFHLDELRRLIECFAKKHRDDHKIAGRAMNKAKKHFAAVAFALAGCEAMTGRTAGQNVDEARISTAVQTTLTADEASNFTRIDLDTTKGVVYLNGTVQSAEQKARAEQLAGRIDGVNKLVINLNLQVGKTQI